MNREFLQLAHNFQGAKHRVAGMYLSEKLDGQRALWDGGVSRGMMCDKVPWANVDKHARFQTVTYATGLWSRYGQPIFAPDWFLDALPSDVCLDGELYLHRGGFQKLRTIVSTRTPDEVAWRDVQFCVFDSPSYGQVFQEGRINNPNFKKELTFSCYNFIESRGKSYDRTNDLPFRFVYEKLKQKYGDGSSRVFSVLPQVLLPQDELIAREIVETMVSNVTSLGGEGIILRSASSFWTPKRVDALLKVKKLIDSEAKVIGYTTGRKTDKESKHLGRMGALVVEWNGKIFELSGFTDEEREFSTADMKNWAFKNPGERTPSWVINDKFPVGSTVTFRYRELTDDGIPREARFWRKG